MMMDNKQRIEQAWRKTRDWITQFDGAPTEAYLANVDSESLPAALQTFSEMASGLRIAAIGGREKDQSVEINQASLPENLARLQAGKLSGLNINALARPAGLDLDLHIVVYTIGSRKVDLEFIWWADQAFPEGVDTAARIRDLLGFFMDLQALFGAQKLYVGPETYEKPGPGSLSWVEI